MLLKSTHYYNAFLNKDGQPFIESRALPYHEILDDIIDTSDEYVYTLVIGDHGTNKLDLEEEARAYESNKKCYAKMERLTGHEMGICPRGV